VVVYAVIDGNSSLGDSSVEVFVDRDEAERFVEEVREEDPERAAHLSIVERDSDELTEEISAASPVAGRAFEILTEVLDGADPGESDPEARRAIEFLTKALEEHGEDDQDDAPPPV
jgi:hypothetical protein